MEKIFLPDARLLEKYNVQVPRYTSYPTVPFWHEHIDIEKWKKDFAESFTTNNAVQGISLYIHLPFCESLCTYCGCNKKITSNHSVEPEYMKAVLKEWRMYTTMMPQKPVIRELHIGGGTPTFFSPQHLKELITAILADCTIAPVSDFSIEGHPNNTTYEHLKTLYDLGFRRISYGVQDNNAEVQRVINRIQPFENVQNATRMAREVGFSSINFDLIYGLPLQTQDGLQKTIKQCLSLAPDRVAFYSYAHVPWTSRGQRLFDESHLPSATEKMHLYRLGKQLFTEAGYTDIGMDHFALPKDSLAIAAQYKCLHRNFMGYTTHHTSLLLGLGVSAISDTGSAFAQNAKKLSDYYEIVNKGELPVQKGYFLNKEDIAFRKYILDISCNAETKFLPFHKALLEQYSIPELEKLRADGLVAYNEESLKVTDLGKNFIRNICKAFDLHLLRSQQSDHLFSKAI